MSVISTLFYIRTSEGMTVQMDQNLDTGVVDLQMTSGASFEELKRDMSGELSTELTERDLRDLKAAVDGALQRFAINAMHAKMARLSKDSS